VSNDDRRTNPRLRLLSSCLPDAGYLFFSR
jgi:hypothetical protein